MFFTHPPKSFNPMSKTEIDFEKIMYDNINHGYFSLSSEALPMQIRNAMEEAIKAALPIILQEAADMIDYKKTTIDNYNSILNLEHSEELKQKLGL